MNPPAPIQKDRERFSPAVSGTPGSGLPLGPVTSLVSDPSNPNVFYAAVTANSANTLEQTSVYISRNAGATWQPVFTAAESNGLIPGAAAHGLQTFIRIATGPNNTVALGVVEGVLLNGRFVVNSLGALFYSSNAGATWREVLLVRHRKFMGSMRGGKQHQ